MSDMTFLVKQNGILLSSEPDPDEVAGAIKYLYSVNSNKLNSFRTNSFDLWREYFNADKNAGEFANHISSLNTKKSGRVVIVTNGYPYGGERSFIEPEIVELYRRFDIVMVALTEGDLGRNEQKAFSDNMKRLFDFSGRGSEGIVVHRIDMSWKMSRFLPYLLPYFFDKGIEEEIKEVFSRNRNKKDCLWESIKYYAKARYFFKEYCRKNGREQGSVFYTFWHTFATLAFCINKDQLGNPAIITREHGYDLYDERCSKTNRQPFREVMEKKLDGVVFACNYGKQYYLHRNGLEDNMLRYSVGYLGTPPPIHKVNGTWGEYDKDENYFRIVSCSDIISLKRIDRIIDALEIIGKGPLDKRIEWVHFGDGPIKDEITKRAEFKLRGLSNIVFIFRGAVDNEFIHKYYSNNRVDCFITTSSTEGFPISIIEAMSYGIPIVATDVGGIKEAFK